MARPLRFLVPGGFYHVMNRGLERRVIVRNDEDRQAFLETLGESVALWRFRVHAFSLMDNHFHLLIETPEGNLSRLMRHIAGVYTQRFNRRYRRDGPLFRGRYKAILLDADSYLLELVRYIHLNPVLAKIVERPENHVWTSHGAYIGKRKGPEWLSMNGILGMFGQKTNEARKRLDAFVKEGVPKELAERLGGRNWPSMMGDDSFKEGIWKRFGREEEEIPETRQWKEHADWTDIVKVILETYGIDESELKAQRKGRNGDPRDALIYVARKAGGMGVKEIADRLGLKRSRASMAFQRADQKMKTDREFEKTVDRILNCFLTT